MTRNSVLRLAAVAALGLILAGPARAAGPEAPVLAAVWEWLEGLWSRSDHGCGIDPNGNPRCAPVTAQSDLGCHIDPNGNPRCAPGM
jgi:hypothetical protein